MMGPPYYKPPADNRDPGDETREDDDTESVLTDEDLYWFGEYCARGMCSPQAAVLAGKPGLDRHAIREWLDKGCDPDLAFLIAS